MHFKHLGEPLVLASFCVWLIGHSMTSCPKSLSA